MKILLVVTSEHIYANRSTFEKTKHFFWHFLVKFCIFTPRKKEAFREKGCLREKTALPTTQALLQTFLVQHRLSGQNRREQPDTPVESGRQLLTTHGQDVLKVV